MSNTVIVPAPLQPGDTIAVAAASSPFDRNNFMDGIRWLESRNFQVTYLPSIFEQQGYLAGSDERRGSELAQWLTNDSVKAIFFARGGYGAMRLWPTLDLLKKPTTPKWLFGFSDLTSLHHYVRDRWGWASLYAPVVTQFKDLEHWPRTRASVEAFFDNHPQPAMALPPAQVYRQGTARARTTGGCLSLLVASLGTPYEFQCNDQILFIEDLNEKPHKVDRMLTQLSLAGKFRKLRGLVFGNLRMNDETLDWRPYLENTLGPTDFPVVYNLPYGHGPDVALFPLGFEATLCTQKGSLEFIQP